MNLAVYNIVFTILLLFIVSTFCNRRGLQGKKQAIGIIVKHVKLFICQKDFVLSPGFNFFLISCFSALCEMYGLRGQTGGLFDFGFNLNTMTSFKLLLYMYISVYHQQLSISTDKCFVAKHRHDQAISICENFTFTAAFQDSFK